MNLISIAHAGVITDAPSISTVGMRILNYLLSVAEIIAIIALVISGILYFVSAGDEKKVELAKRAVNYSVMGVAMALGGLIIVKLIGEFFSGQ